jgi:hypothetical protein
MERGEECDAPLKRFPTSFSVTLSLRRTENVRLRCRVPAALSGIILNDALVPHLRAGSVFTFGDKFEANVRTAMGTLRSDRPFVDYLILVLFEPHELEALGAATDLRCHSIPRTLRPTRFPDLRGVTLV